MTVAWMLYAVLVSMAFAVAAAALARAARMAGLPTRWAWASSMVLSTLWPVAMLARAADRASDPASDAGALLPATIVDGASGIVEAALVRAALLDRIALALWLLSALVLVARLVAGARQLGRARPTWRRARIDGVWVLESQSHGPAVIGSSAAEIVVPAWVRSLEPAQRALVLAHEQEHVRARDTVLLHGAAILRALLPWNAALWWQSRQLALAVELDCDARVLRRGASADRYARLLLAITARQSGLALEPALSAFTSHLERRIDSMRPSRPARPLLRAGLIAALGALAVIVACSAPTPDAPPTVAGPAGAEAPAQTQVPGETYFEFQVEQQILPLRDNRAPRYPDELRRRNIEGDVIVQFVVNGDGIPDPATFKVLRASHPAFEAAVREALPAWRFQPAEISGRPVRQVVQMPFVFSLDHQAVSAPARRTNASAARGA